MTSEEQEQVPVSEALREELEAFARTEGHPDFAGWAASEGHGALVADDLSWVDQSVLDIVQRGGG